jgi:serine/threonine protein kinase
VKIGDFGISKRIADANTAFRTFIGTRDYMGPELFHYLDSQDEDEDEYSNAVDIWAVGCIVFKLIAKKPPFPPGASLRRYCSNQELFPSEVIAACTSPSCVEFLKRLLTPEPVQRPLAREALEESWITSDTSLESSNVGGSVQPTDTHDNRVDVEAKTVRPESGEEFPSHGADNETDSTIKHATKNEVNIQGSTVKEASSDYILDHQTVENGLFSEPMDSPGSVEPDVDRARIQNLIAGDKDLDRMVENLNPRRVENINPRMVENIKHGPAARTTEDYFRKPFPEKPAERTPSGNFITPSPAHDTHKKQSPSTRNRKQLPSLPPARELDARIQEARTSAKLLLQFMETYRTDDAVGNGLIREFADRCRSASRSIQAYMISENPAPDGNTLSLLAQTRDDLAVAIFKHSRVFGEPVDAMMTPTSPKTASEGVSRQSESQKPGSLDATRHKMNKSRQKKELQATTDRESRREVGMNRESRGVVGVNTESRGEVGAMGFLKKLSLRLEAPYQNEIKSREAKPSESITASLSDSNAVSPTRKIPETFLGLSAAAEDLRRLRTPGSRQPMGSNSPPENDSDEYFVPVNLSDVWLQVIESGQLYWTHEETGCILFTNPRFAILPPGWAMRTSPFESKPRILYVHHNTQTKSWDFPRHELPEQVLLSFEDQSLAEDWFKVQEETKWVHKSFRVYVEIDPKWPLPPGWVAYDNFTTDQVPVHFFYVFSGARISYDPRSSHIGRLKPSTS